MNDTGIAIALVTVIAAGVMAFVTMSLGAVADSKFASGDDRGGSKVVAVGVALGAFMCALGVLVGAQL